ncbi:tyrosyl-DNA phosphodiesterase domain protein [Amylocarpus encephaloides]|uniref:Tyrosyl-DNA phosphodiesterase domain protein n=1 Tax=Amylocarpus encephaloides TaxID=45428 RepID=A0A9P7YT20_9HELO|nr:tyrosyl-DNA phosphodiesterase domain protein [Amylocarpus encephaloides]
MSDDESDEDLRRAIALSLEEHTAPPGNRAVVDLVSSDEDDDLDAPLVAKPTSSPRKKTQIKVTKVPTPVIDLSGDDEEPKAAYHKPDQETSQADQKPAGDEMPVARGILGTLNRKQMEEERLARARRRKEQTEASSSTGVSRKRKATSPHESSIRVQKQSITRPSTSLSWLPTRTPHSKLEPDTHVAKSDGSPSVDQGVLHTSLSEGEHQQHPPRRLPVNAEPRSIQNGKHTDRTREILSFQAQQQSVAPGIQYPDGVVKKTWAYGFPRQGDDIKIEEVLQKSDLEHAVLSAFQIDAEWIQTKLDVKTKVIWVLQAKTEKEKANYRSQTPDNYRFCFPSMEGNINCMHSKLQLLAHPSHLRIVVPSANLMPYDWGEAGGIMENVCFLIDLPRYPGGKAVTPETFFAKELVNFLNAMGLQNTVVGSLRNFDFSRTADLAFIHSIGGSHSGANLKRTGYCGLGAAVQQLGLQTEQALSVDLVAASIGSLTMGFIKSILLAIQGDDGMTEYGWRANKPRRGKPTVESEVERRLSDDVKKHFRIYFPTRDTVANSKGGIGAGGTICTQSRWYNGDLFPRELMRDCKSRRPGMLMHSKIIFVRGGVKSWAYVGSANLSESAWGHLSKDRTTQQPKLNCRNWECGVIFPVRASDGDVVQRGNNGTPGMEVFTGHVPVPMIVPGEEYAGRTPWFNTKMA